MGKIEDCVNIGGRWFCLADGEVTEFKFERLPKNPEDEDLRDEALKLIAMKRFNLKEV
jgi:hypothetical protein